MQRGTIVKQNKKWCLRYYETVLKGSQPVRKKSFKVLASIGKDYPSKTSVLTLADKILQPINTKQQVPESSLQLSTFIENHYLPWARLNLRPSTVNGYEKDIYNIHLKERLGDIRLRDFRTVTGQRLIAGIPNVGHKTLQRIKSFVSGVLTYALREGILDGNNPMHPVKVPGRPAKFKGGVYSMQEIFNMLEALEAFDGDRQRKKCSYAEVPKGTAQAVICTAAFTGLRLSELRGLRWSDYNGRTLNITRSVWRTHVQGTKTIESEASVPVIPTLQRVLEKYRDLIKPKPEDYIFAGPRRGAPLDC
jgi:integrase